MNAIYSTPIIKNALQTTPNLTVKQLSDITGLPEGHIYYILNASDYCVDFIKTSSGNHCTYENI